MTRELDFSGRSQLYYQIYDFMFQDIADGKYQVGALVPSEKELMEHYHVSRATIRKAMEMLTNEGLVERRRGQGTYVKSRIAKSEDQKVISFDKEQEERKGAYIIKKVINMSVMDPEPEVADRLKLKNGEQVIMLKRIRCLDDVPKYMETNYISYSWAPEAMEHDFSKESLRVFYRTHCNIILCNAEEQIYAINADNELARLLQIKTGDPVFHVKRISYDENGIPREFVHVYYRADSYHLSVKMSL